MAPRSVLPPAPSCLCGRDCASPLATFPGQHLSLIDLYDEALTTDWGVYARLAFASAVGLDVPEAHRAAEEAYATLEEVDAYHLLEMWKDVLPAESAEVAS